MTSNIKFLNFLDNLLEVIQQRKSLEEMESTETVVVLESVLDAVINDSCDYVSVLQDS